MAAVYSARAACFSLITALTMRGPMVMVKPYTAAPGGALEQAIDRFLAEVEPRFEDEVKNREAVSSADVANGQ